MSDESDESALELAGYVPDTVVTIESFDSGSWSKTTIGRLMLSMLFINRWDLCISCEKF